MAAVRCLGGLGLVLAILAARAEAQAIRPDPSGAVAGVGTARTVLVTPHQVVLAPDRKTAALTFTNPGDARVEADVLLQLVYPYRPVADTAVFFANWAARGPRDTVVARPTSSDWYAGAWISGVPAHVTLGPREARTVTLAITPPAGLPDGEYTARITTVVDRSRRKGPGKDTKATFKMPINASQPDGRDSAEVFYRQGVTATGVEVLYANGAVDEQERKSPFPQFEDHQLWTVLRVRPVGPAQFVGQVRYVARREESGETFVFPPAYELTLRREEVLHFWTKTNHLPPGKYVMEITFEASPPATIGEESRLPVKPTTVRIPFALKD